MASFISARGLTVELDGQALLAPTSFELEAGRTLAVTGPNGAGKTTLLRLLAGRTTTSARTGASSGTLTIAGQAPDDTDPDFRRRVSALLGLQPLARDLTLTEHLTLVAASWGSRAASAESTASGLLADLGIAALAARFPHELSTGQRQLFALALALARPFDLLVLDEPEQRLDADRLDLVAGKLRALVDDGRTLVLASHSPVLVEALGGQALPLTETG